LTLLISCIVEALELLSMTPPGGQKISQSKGKEETRSNMSHVRQ
jgi:hypothetical protein